MVTPEFLSKAAKTRRSRKSPLHMTVPSDQATKTVLPRGLTHRDIAGEISEVSLNLHFAVASRLAS
jgi:hypothetical protein